MQLVSESLTACFPANCAWKHGTPGSSSLILLCRLDLVSALRAFRFWGTCYRGLTATATARLRPYRALPPKGGATDLRPVGPENGITIDTTTRVGTIAGRMRRLERVSRAIEARETRSRLESLHYKANPRCRVKIRIKITNGVSTCWWRCRGRDCGRGIGRFWGRSRRWTRWRCPGGRW